MLKLETNSEKNVGVFCIVWDEVKSDMKNVIKQLDWSNFGSKVLPVEFCHDWLV